MTTQVAYGADGARSRIDLLLSRGGAPAPGSRGERRPYVGDERVYVEVKSTTMRLAPGIAAFPDAVTERGRKHLEDLRGVVAAGHRAALVLIVQRGDCSRFAPADAIDPAWGAELRRSIAAGVEVYALRARVDAEALEACARMELLLRQLAREGLTAAGGNNTATAMIMTTAEALSLAELEEHRNVLEGVWMAPVAWPDAATEAFAAAYRTHEGEPPGDQALLVFRAFARAWQGGAGEPFSATVVRVQRGRIVAPPAEVSLEPEG